MNRTYDCWMQVNPTILRSTPEKLARLFTAATASKVGPQKWAHSMRPLKTGKQ